MANGMHCLRNDKDKSDERCRSGLSGRQQQKACLIRIAI
jgi:hypothetical protein